MYVYTHIIDLYIHTYTICILSAFILYFCGISNFRCMLKVPRGTVTKISKNKKNCSVLALVVCADRGVRTSAKLDRWPGSLGGSSTASVPAIFIYCLWRRVPSFV